jgi:mono/diheme cytochrome c family protein
MQQKFCLSALVAAAGLAAICGTARAGSTAAYTAAQATQGKTVYAGQCASCHGAALQGNIGPALKGKSFQQMAAAQQLTAASLLAVISASMPKDNPGGLSPAQYGQVTAYILRQGGYPAGRHQLTAKASQAKALSLTKPPSGVK